jgi:hypothetical protein
MLYHNWIFFFTFRKIGPDSKREKQNKRKEKKRKEKKRKEKKNKEGRIEARTRKS